jgi:ATP-dependent DNA helicase RecG
LEHISEEKVRWFLRKAKGERNLDVDPQISLEEVLEKLGLIIDGKLTNAVVLMFGKAPQRYFVQSEVRCARFKGTKAVKPFIDMKVMDGAVYEQIDQAEKFVLFNMKKAAWVEPGKIERQEKWEYPPEAIREAITNAVAHRDYFSSGNVQIRIFDDRIEVWNPGCLPEGLTVEKLKGKHESKPRNKLIARMFFLIKYIEQWGTGTNEMIHACVSYGLPEPLFEDTGSSFIVTFRKSRLTEEFLESLNLNDRQYRTIGYVKDRGEITNKIYREIHNVGKVTAAAELNDLVAQEVLKIVGKGRSTKYILNEY